MLKNTGLRLRLLHLTGVRLNDVKGGISAFYESIKHGDRKKLFRQGPVTKERIEKLKTESKDKGKTKKSTEEAKD